MANESTKVQTYDYSLFGNVEVKPLSRIRQVIAKRMAASWTSVPHVAQFDELDLTALEKHRAELAPQAPSGVKLTLLAYAMQACARALKAFPEFNASLDESGQNLVLKRYCHIAFAADTPLGLMAPVLRDVDQKGLLQLAGAIGALATRAKAGGLLMSDAEGACFTVTNLGALGGTGFTPVINAPEIGILALARACPKPVCVDGHVVTRPILPLCLAYDHRVIDGAVGGRFMAFIRQQLLAPQEFDCR